MRLEQLVLYGPGEDERVRFGPALTVLAGLGPEERAELIETVVGALTGRLPNASVVYVDEQGRRVYADRTGASYADTGDIAPTLSDLLGQDPEVVARLVTLDAADLGRTGHTGPVELQETLAEARAEADRLRHDLEDTRNRASTLDALRNELCALDRRIEDIDDEADHWRWVQLRDRLEAARQELAAADGDGDDDGSRDRRLLEAVDALRATGAQWADLAAEAAELREQLGNVPHVSPEDLTRVASTPEDLPAAVHGRVDGWRTARERRVAAEAGLAAVQAPPPVVDDPVTEAFARLDQQALWRTHARLQTAEQACRELTDGSPEDQLDPESEARIERAHVEVLRCQRAVERHGIVGTAGAGLLVALALFATVAVAPLAGLAVLIVAALVAWRFVFVPRTALTRAKRAETAALSQVQAGSWLGLHLRRLDSLTDATDRRRYEDLATELAAARSDWAELTDGRSVDELDARAVEVRQLADQLDPRTVAARRRRAEEALAEARAAERDACTSLFVGLERYGLPRVPQDDLDPESLVIVLTQRVQAGHVARRVMKLEALEAHVHEAAVRLDDLLTHLGIEPGDLETRLDRAIEAVAAARARQESPARLRSRDEIAREVAELEALVEELDRGWGDDDPVTAPPAADALEERRRALTQQISEAGRPDPVAAERASELAEARVRELAGALADPLLHQSLEQRLVNRLRRTTRVGDHEETVPVIVDDALAGLGEQECIALLERITEVAEETQVVLLSQDPVVDRWARERVGSGPITLYESAETAAVS